MWKVVDAGEKALAGPRSGKDVVEVRPMNAEEWCRCAEGPSLGTESLVGR